MSQKYLPHLLLFCCCLVSVDVLCAQEDAGGLGLGPTLKFFFFDERQTEWVVSTEPDRLQIHLDKNSDSASLFDSLQASVEPPEDMQPVRSSMSDWVKNERARFEEAGGRNTHRIRVAEGVTAYMRAHDFETHKLIESLLKRSGANDVELAAIHLIDDAGNSSYKLKVMLPSDTLQLERQGFDVVLGSSRVTYASVVYALALALFEVHEIINAETPDDTVPDTLRENLPVPESLPAPADTSLPGPLSDPRGSPLDESGT